jgi:serine/threonine-protein kinase RsbT
VARRGWRFIADRVVKRRKYVMKAIGETIRETTGTRLIRRPRLMRAPVTDPRGGLRLASWAASVSARTEARLAAETLVPETRLAIRSNGDIVAARRNGTALVQQMGFSNSRITLVNTVISELARNILLYASVGEIVLSRLKGGAELKVTALDHGPGIENLPVVLAGGYSTSGGLGLGLSGLRRIVNEFDIKTQPGMGTQVNVSIRA